MTDHPQCGTGGCCGTCTPGTGVGNRPDNPATPSYDESTGRFLAEPAPDMGRPWMRNGLESDADLIKARAAYLAEHPEYRGSLELR